jgi:DNA helicase-2/ATP-dependent DNA helicase PcrA
MLPSRVLEELRPEFVRHEAVRRQRFYESNSVQDPDTSMPYYEDESQESDPVRAGRWVMHASFGRGRIVSVDGKGENLKVTVDFENSGHKKILVKYGNLRLI